MANDDSYVPKSPDLSAFYSDDPAPTTTNTTTTHQNHSTAFGAQQRQSSYSGSQSAGGYGFGFGQSLSPSYRRPSQSAHSYQAPYSAGYQNSRQNSLASPAPFYQPPKLAPYVASPGPQQESYQPPQSPVSSYQSLERQRQTSQSIQAGTFTPYNPPHRSPQQQPQPYPQHRASNPHSSPSQSESSRPSLQRLDTSQALQQQQQYHQQRPYEIPQTLSPSAIEQGILDASMPRGSRAATAAAHAADGADAAGEPAEGYRPQTATTPTTSASAGSIVKTRFPTARIKRIMQSDDEVGKVAQQAPIAVAKALEMFMVALVSESGDLARAGNQRRVTAQHMKQVVMEKDQWDFLRDVVAKVSDEERPRGGRGGGELKGAGAAAAAKTESDVTDDDDHGAAQTPAPKKRGRKKKAA